MIVLADDGVELARVGESHGRAMGLDELPPELPLAVVATEDRRFYDHFGIDMIGLARAMVRNIRAGRTVQGGSTITQQLAKNLFLTPERSVKRKAQEAMLALRLESRFSKAEIPTCYFTRVFLGARSYGVDAAARRYFGIGACAPDLYQSSMIAG